MSHAEAFENLRSFVVGLETKARDLRKVLESSRDDDGKWINGKDGTGIGERCARAIGAASPAQVTKEMIAEVAEQDRRMRDVEEIMRTDKPVEEVTERYQALVEYNQLALEDLEERLSAYGYVRPARLTLVTNAAAAVGPCDGSSVMRAPSRAEAVGGSTAPHDVGRKKPTGGSSGGAPEKDGAKVSAGCSATAGIEGVGRSDDLDAGVAVAEASVCDGCGTDDNVGGDEEETAADGVAGDNVDMGLVSPTRLTLTLREDPEEGPDSPPTPASPGLADWEISEEAQMMLRQGQKQQQQQKQQDNQSESGGPATVPRSLEALLAGNTALSGGGGVADGGAGAGRQSSLSSNWSPPPSPTEAAFSRSSSHRWQTSTRLVEGEVEGAHVGTPANSVLGGATERTETPVTRTEGRAEMSSWGASSNPPTPARMAFEGGQPQTPDGRDPSAAGTVEDRESSSLGTPSLTSRSPLNNDITAYLVQTALSCGKRPDIRSTPREQDISRSATISPPKPSPIKRMSLEGHEASLVGGLPHGRQGEFWGITSPASSVVASSREATAEHYPVLDSPASPATPRVASSRLLVESGGFDGDDGRGAAGVCSAGRVTRSASRRTTLTPTTAERRDILCSHRNLNNLSCSDNVNHNSSRSENCDSDACPTPELSSPLRSVGSMSVRDLRVLTPSARINTSGGGGGEYNGGSIFNLGGSNYDDSDKCPTPELSSPLRSTGSAALCRRRLKEAEGGICHSSTDDEDGEAADAFENGNSKSDGPLELVSEEEYARAPKFLTIQVSRSVLNETIGNLNAYAVPRLGSPSELLLTVDEIMGIIDQGELSRTLLLSAAHLKRIEMKGPRMYRIRA